MALYLVDPPLGAEDPLVGADRLAVRTHGRIWLPIARAAFATWSGLKTSQPTRIGGDEEQRQLLKAAVEQEDEADDGDDPAVDLARVFAQQRAEVVADIVAGGQRNGREHQRGRQGREQREGESRAPPHDRPPSTLSTYQRLRLITPRR